MIICFLQTMDPVAESQKFFRRISQVISIQIFFYNLLIISVNFNFFKILSDISTFKRIFCCAE
ncbi:hypothetical protein Hanom_Chr10g00957141 [Helianthus anomalus]